jgi:DNA-binding NtrC family response regulator
MAHILVEAQQLAFQNCPVLIHGETGTGKELMARVIHGGRGPFVVIDCTHLTSQLAESELFGCVRGAYTSADSERSGLIEAANGGTAFFDEIGELPLDVQAKLLRLLQQKTFRRVGSSYEQRSEFRIIAATHRDLKRDSQAGHFRQDLYYRLNVAKIKIPALRERKEDIPLLVQHFLQPTGLEASPEIIKSFLRYHWPGNVRELENCLRRMVAKSYGSQLSPSHLPATVCADTVEQTPQLLRMASALRGTDSEFPDSLQVTGSGEQPAVDSVSATSQPLPEVPLLSLQKLEFLAILRALREADGDRTRAAALLEIGRTTLYRKLQEMEKHPQFHLALRQITSEIT